MLILGIDPGNETSAFLLWDTEKDKPIDMGILQNKDLAHHLTRVPVDIDIFAIEFPQSYGLAVGKTIFHTCRWVGRFEAAGEEGGLPSPLLIGRPTIKGHIGGRTDAEIRASLRIRYGDAKKGERLGGVKKDIWAALALCVAIQDNPNIKQVIE